MTLSVAGSRRCWVRFLKWALAACLIIAVLAAISISQYQDYTARSGVSEGPLEEQTAQAEQENQTAVPASANVPSDLPPPSDSPVPEAVPATSFPATAPVAAAPGATDDGSGFYDSDRGSADFASIGGPPRLASAAPDPPSSPMPDPTVPEPPSPPEPPGDITTISNATSTPIFSPPQGPRREYTTDASATGTTADGPPIGATTLAWNASIHGGDRHWCREKCLTGSPELTSGQEYNAVVSLGPSLQAGARVSPILEELAAKASPANPRTFNLIPLFDDELTPSGEGLEPARLTYKGPPTPASPLETANFPFSVQEGATGCAQIWVSVWDRDMTKALDAFVISVALGTAQSGPSTCTVDEEKRAAVVAGAGSVLDVLASASGLSSGVAGMHAFEMTVRNVTSSKVVVVGRDKPDEPQIYGWPLKENLSTSLDSERMAKILGAARLDLVKESESARSKAYEKTGDAIRSAIFRPKNTQAEAAFELLQRVVQVDPGATFAARFTKGYSEGQQVVFYVPLRFLAKAKHGLPADQFHVVQPLPGRHEGPKACIARWTIAASPFLGLQNSNASEDVEAYRDVQKPREERWRGPVIGDIEDLRKYFAGYYVQEPLPENQSEALVILGHHGSASGILYSEGGQSVLASEIQRAFPRGSAAFLAMCSASEPKSADGVVHMLAESGFDTLVASPFQVSSAYSTRLLDKLMQRVDESYREQKQPTIKELFDLAARDAAATYGKQSEAGQQALEFVIAGNPDLTICKLPLMED